MYYGMALRFEDGGNSERFNTIGKASGSRDLHEKEILRVAPARVCPGVGSHCQDGKKSDVFDRNGRLRAAFNIDNFPS